MLFQSAARESAIQATLVLREESAEVAPKDQSLAGGSNKHYDILADDQYAEAYIRFDAGTAVWINWKPVYLNWRGLSLDRKPIS